MGVGQRRPRAGDTIKGATHRLQAQPSGCRCLSALQPGPLRSPHPQLPRRPHEHSTHSALLLLKASLDIYVRGRKAPPEWEISVVLWHRIYYITQYIRIFITGRFRFLTMEIILNPSTAYDIQSFYSLLCGKTKSNQDAR